METIELTPKHEKRLSFEELGSLSDKDRKEIDGVKLVLADLSINIDDDFDEELDLGHVIVKLKNAIYTTNFEKYEHGR